MPVEHTPESFWALTLRVGPCLEWTGCRSTDGYGLVKFRGSPWRAHRLAWTLARGPIPEGLFVCHTCDNRSCIELLHLFLGVHGDNMRDRKAKGGYRTAARGERNGAAKLTETDVRQIRELRSSGALVATIARRFHVSVRMVDGIVHHREWRHIQ